MDALRVLIVAEDPLARAGLAALLAGPLGNGVVGQTPGDRVAEALEVYQPDALLWDLGWDAPPDLDPLIAAAEGAPPIVALLPDASTAPSAWAAGARGLLLRHTDADHLEAALRAVRGGLAVLDPALASHLPLLPDAPPAEALTARELEVLALLAEGLSNRGIAVRLAISEHTVKFHLNAILSKLGAQSRTEAVVRGIRLGLIHV